MIARLQSHQLWNLAWPNCQKHFKNLPVPKKALRQNKKQLHTIKLNGEQKSKRKSLLQWKSFVTWQIVLLKIKIKLVSITAAANCSEHEFYDLMMQCLHCLRNAYNRITLLICCKWLAAKRFHIYHYPYIFFSRCHVRNLMWNWYGSMEDRFPFYFWNLPFHFILASSIFHTEISLPFHFPFHSIPWF